MQVVTATLVLGAIASLVAWVILLLLEHGIRPVHSMVHFVRRLPWSGRLAVLPLFIALVVVGSTKFSGNNVSDGNNLQMTNAVEGVVSGGVAVGRQDVPVTNSELDMPNSEQESIGATADEVTSSGSADAETQIQLSVNDGEIAVPDSITALDCEAGFVLSGVGYGEEFDFAPPNDAVVCEDWLRFGAHEDWFHLPLGWFSFPFGSNVVNALTVLASGTLYPAITNASTFIAPLKASWGIVPMANWGLVVSGQSLVVRGESIEPDSYSLTTNDCISQFWHCFTPSNTVLFTWRNVLLERDADKPVSFQCEISHNGDMMFRYDLSRLIENPTTNVLVGLSNGQHERLYNALSNTITSLRWSHLDRQDYLVPDRDGDGISTADEIFIHRTDPGNADTDMDGLSDGEELSETETDPLNPFSVNPSLPDSIAIATGDIDPFSVPQGSTNTVLEHLFYTGTMDGEIAYPEETDSSAVLEVSVSGTGSGVLQVGGVSVPLVAPQASAYSRTRSAPSSSPLLVDLQKGVTHPVFLMGDSSHSVAFGSSGFAFGELPSLAEGRFMGWINFPNTKATVPCIHDLRACQTQVHLPIGEDAAELTCTWMGSGDVEADNHPPRSAQLTGEFSPKSQAEVSYTLNHPKALFGARSYSQRARFCPQLEENEEEPEDEEDPDDGDSGDGSDDDSDGNGNDGNDNDDDEEEEDHACDENCDCWQSSDNGDLPPDDGTDDGNPDLEPEPEPDPENCPEHGVPFEECRSEHEEEYEEASRTYAQLQGVLLLRNPTHYHDIWLDVPDEDAPQCCPCPDHATNYVSASYVSGRLSLLDENGARFSRTTKSCNVFVGGVSPSKGIGDARLMFSHNGRTCRDTRYTVFGVGISSAANVRLSALNATKPSFGLPLIVGTNSINANLNLDLKVRLQTGRVRLSFTGATGSFKMLYHNPYAGGWCTLIDTENRPFIDMDIYEWRNLFRKRHDAAFSAPVAIVSAEAGHCDIEFRYWLGNGIFAEDVATQRITAVNPPLIPDMNLDGQIDDADVSEYIKGRLFRYWFNEDTVKGDYDGHIPDYARNAADSVVNGRYDLVNLFAARLDLKPFIDAWGSSVKFGLSAYGEDTMRYCAVDVNPNEAGKIYTDDTFTKNANVPLHSAPLTALQYDGISIDPSELLGEGNAPGVLAFEAAAAHENVTLKVKLGDETILSFPMPISISSVRDMYRWNNIRSACGGTGGEPSRLYEPDNLPDSECDGRHFVFVHGYNVNSADARKWGDQMFKRLRLSGMKSMFTAVNWKGDESQFSLMFSDKQISPDYYVNVKNAFQSAPALVQACRNLPGEKVMLAHSLGNMLVSSAAKDHGLNYSKYYMLNAAVPMEAYDNGSFSSVMCDEEWEKVPSNYLAANWSKLFPVNDFRASLSWRGRFAGIANAVNCYSPTEDVLTNAEVGQLTLSGGAWKIQEFTKGTTVWHELNSLPFFDLNVACEGGWGINTYYSLNPLWYVYQCGFTDKVQSDMTREDAITHPLFTPFRSESEAMHSTNLFTIADATYREQLRAKFLADAIPATSFAAGANYTRGLMDNHNVQDDIPNGWPTQREEKTPDGVISKWLHSDLKDVSFFYVYQLFNKIIKGE